MNNCIFCKIVNNELPSMKIFEDEYTLAFMDIAKDVDGHIVVVPKKHIKNIMDCDYETLNHVMKSAKAIANHLVEQCGYDGINVLNASGESADQSVPHLHFHLIPRKNGDGIDAWPVFNGAQREIADVYNEISMI